MKELSPEEIQKKSKFYNDITACLDWCCSRLVIENVAPKEFMQHYITTLPDRKWILEHYLKWEKKEKKKKKT